MHKILETIDNLFYTNGWNVEISKDNNRIYYRKHYELERYEIKDWGRYNFKVIVPLKLDSFYTIVNKNNVYDYLYSFLTKSI